MNEIRSTTFVAKAMLLTTAMTCFAVGTALADEGGTSFWRPGQYGSFAAAPATPGWTMPVQFYHTSAENGGSRELLLGGEIVVNIEADANLVNLVPTYTFHDPVLNGQLSLSVAGVYGNLDVLGEVQVGPFMASREDSVLGFGDLYPTMALRWNEGTSNFMTYITGNLPVGDYKKGRIANIGLNHASIDGGVGYTYLNPGSGREFSIVTGLTYNFENDATDYQNGIDLHVDFAASQFMSATTHIGIVGYAYQQLTGDSGDGAKLGDFKSRVFGIGPQIGHFFPVGGSKAYVNLKGYYEFGAENRLEGWNATATISIPLGG